MSVCVHIPIVIVLVSSTHSSTFIYLILCTRFGLVFFLIVFSRVFVFCRSTADSDISRLQQNSLTLIIIVYTMKVYILFG